jgi:hypothetical protein
MNGYIAMYKGRRLEVYANTLAEAKNEAIQHFQEATPRRKVQAHQVWVMLAEIDGKEVVHTPDF